MKSNLDTNILVAALGYANEALSHYQIRRTREVERRTHEANTFTTLIILFTDCNTVFSEWNSIFTVIA